VRIHNNRSSRNLFLGLIFLCLVLFSFSILAHASDSRQGVYPAKVRDISDWKYEPALIELLDNAKESIVISVYIMPAGEKETVKLIMKNLEKALDRGVNVEIYMNTRFFPKSADGVVGKEIFSELRGKGAKIFAVTHSTHLYDKLLIVDERYTVIGGIPWSVLDPKDHYGSSTLIDSPKFVGETLARLRTFPLEEGT